MNTILILLLCISFTAFVLVCDTLANENAELRDLLERNGVDCCAKATKKSKEAKALETLNSLDYLIVQANKAIRWNIEGIETDLQRLFKNLSEYEVVRERISPRFEKVEVLRTDGSGDSVHCVFVMSPISDEVLTQEDIARRKNVAKLDMFEGK